MFVTQKILKFNIFFVFCLFFLFKISIAAQAAVPASCIVSGGYARLDAPIKNELGAVQRHLYFELVKKVNGAVAYSGNTGEDGYANLNSLDPTSEQTEYYLQVYNEQKQAITKKEIKLRCGQVYSTPVYLSEIKVSVRNFDNSTPLKYAQFNVYERVLNAPYEKGVLVASGVSTGSDGVAYVTLPEGSYTIEIPKSGGGNYYIYKAQAQFGSATAQDYVIADRLNIQIKTEVEKYDAYNNKYKEEILVANKKMEIYKVEFVNNVPQETTLLKSEYLSSDRGVTFDYPGYNYTIKLVEPSGTFTYLKNVATGKDEVYDSELEAKKVIFKLGSLTVQAQDKDDKDIRGALYNLYQQVPGVGGNIYEKVGNSLIATDELTYFFPEGTYAFEFLGTHQYETTYWTKDIKIEKNKLTEVVFNDYLGAVVYKLINADGVFLENFTYSVYEQNADKTLNKIIATVKQVKENDYTPFYINDPFAVVVGGDAPYYYYNETYQGKVSAYIGPSQERASLNILKLEFIRVFVTDKNNAGVADEEVTINEVRKNEADQYLFVKKITSKKSNYLGQVDFYVPQGYYEIIYKGQSKIVHLSEKGKEQVFLSYLAGPSSNQTTALVAAPAVSVNSTVSDSPAATVVSNSQMGGRLRGRLLLQVQDRGRVWYVSPVSLRRYEVTKTQALNLFRSLSLGITNDNLNKIVSNLDFIGKVDDSDGDGVSDITELQNMTNPFGSGKFTYDKALAARLAGRLLLQVQDKGRIWYVSPVNLEKYEVTLDNIMSLFITLSLGITNADLNLITQAELGN